MEPLFFKAENVNPEDGVKAVYELQWSRFFSKRKIPVGAETSPRHQGASMEPLFFKAENTARPVCSAGRALESFNGAAFFQSGKCWVLGVMLEFIVSFNGAAFFQSGKLGCSCDEIRQIVQASMEPLFFKAENKSSPIRR